MPLRPPARPFEQVLGQVEEKPVTASADREIAKPGWREIADPAGQCQPGGERADMAAAKSDQENPWHVVGRVGGTCQGRGASHGSTDVLPQAAQQRAVEPVRHLRLAIGSARPGAVGVDEQPDDQRCGGHSQQHDQQRQERWHVRRRHLG